MIFRATCWKPENNIELKVKAGFINENVNSNDNVDDDCYSNFNNYEDDLHIFQLNDNNSNIEYLNIFNNDDADDKNDDDDNDDDDDDGSDNDIDTPKQRLHNLKKTN